MTRYVLGFLFVNAGTKVLLVRKAKPEWQKGKWNGIGGKVEAGETPAAAMHREFCEEVTHPANPLPEGLQADAWKERLVMGGHDWEIIVYAASWPVPFVVNDAGDEPCEWHCQELLPFDVIPNLRWMIPLCLDQEVFHARIGYNH